jgi:hypothetical protein
MGSRTSASTLAAVLLARRDLDGAYRLVQEVQVRGDTAKEVNLYRQMRERLGGNLIQARSWTRGDRIDAVIHLARFGDPEAAFDLMSTVQGPVHLMVHFFMGVGALRKAYDGAGKVNRLWLRQALDELTLSLDTLRLSAPVPPLELPGCLRAFQQHPDLAVLRDGAFLGAISTQDREAVWAFLGRFESILLSLRK